jgi:hypothetical protein
MEMFSGAKYSGIEEEDKNDVELKTQRIPESWFPTNQSEKNDKIHDI